VCFSLHHAILKPELESSIPIPPAFQLPSNDVRVICQCNIVLKAVIMHDRVMALEMKQIASL
jgi:hypothetical protein